MDPTLSCRSLQLSFGLLIWSASMDMQPFFTPSRKRRVPWSDLPAHPRPTLVIECHVGPEFVIM